MDGMGDEALEPLLLQPSELLQGRCPAFLRTLEPCCPTIPGGALVEYLSEGGGLLVRQAVPPRKEDPTDSRASMPIYRAAGRKTA